MPLGPTEFPDSAIHRMCGRSFANQYSHTRGGGELIAFADFDDSGMKAGYAPGITGAAWVCNEHRNAARERSSLTTIAAIQEMQRAFGVRAIPPAERRR